MWFARLQVGRVNECLSIDWNLINVCYRISYWGFSQIPCLGYWYTSSNFLSWLILPVCSPIMGMTSLLSCASRVCSISSNLFVDFLPWQDQTLSSNLKWVHNAHLELPTCSALGAHFFYHWAMRLSLLHLMMMIRKRYKYCTKSLVFVFLWKASWEMYCNITCFIFRW